MSAEWRARGENTVLPEEDDHEFHAVSDDTTGSAAVEDIEFAPHPCEIENAASVLGEFDAESEEEDVNFASSVADSVKPLPVPEAFQTLMEERIQPLIKLEALEQERQEFLAMENLPENIKMLLSMQVAEVRSLPEKDVALEKRLALETRIAQTRAQAAKQEEEAAEHPPKRGEKPAPLISPELERAWELGECQCTLLLQRGEALEKVLQFARGYLKAEPLYLLLTSLRFPADTIFCYAIYQLGLENWSRRVQGARRELQKQLSDVGEGSKRLFARANKEEGEQRNRLGEQIERYTTIVNCLNKEIASLQKKLVAEFWKAYEFCACLLVSGKLSDNRMVVLRALLRYGLLGHAPWFVSPEVQRYLIGDCIGSVKTEYDPSMCANHVLYADEYINYVVGGNITPSIDENLELSARNSPEWNADKAQRRLAYSRTRASALRERRMDLVARVAHLREQQEEMLLVRSKLLKTAKDYKKRNAELAQSIQHCKVEAARFERVVQRIDEKEVQDLAERAAMARDRLDNSGVSTTAFHLARKEASAIHRVCRLCAKLKDPFLPFVLRDNFRLDVGVVNSRMEIDKRLKQIEMYDRNIFNETLVNSRKESQRIYLRFHPIFLITPSCGFLGYSWNPRVGVETGKLVFPGYCPRAGISERMLYNMLADFRWDTSKAAAGVDLLTSDTLVAAYSAVRWDYRKRKRENREKALIFNEVNDRTNWRRHYELYLQSAADAGRKLFFKNYEVYDVIFRYIGLPEGAERLRR